MSVHLLKPFLNAVVTFAMCHFFELGLWEFSS